MCYRRGTPESIFAGTDPGIDRSSPYRYALKAHMYFVVEWAVVVVLLLVSAACARLVKACQRRRVRDLLDPVLLRDVDE